MMFKICTLVLLLTTMWVSCNNRNEEANKEHTGITNADTSQEIKNEIAAIDKDSIIKRLEGKWKEPEYPFRVAHFNNKTVKFIEEGVVEEPRFEEYRILKECPFEVNNIKNAKSDDIFLVMVEDKTCEILQISHDSLILSGFSVNTNSNYRIIYKKEE